MLFSSTSVSSKACSVPRRFRGGLAAVLVCAAVLFVPDVVHAQIYVDAGATGSDDGSSWTDAYTDLQDALAEATGNDEIWIAEGIYYPDEGAGITGGDPSASFEITGVQDGLKIYGGFDGSEATVEARDPKAHPVILSGDIDQQDIDPDDDGVIEDVDDMRGENSRHVLIFNGGTSIGADVGSSENITPATVLDGVTVTAGHAVDSGGGGLYCDGSGSGNNCSPTLSNIVFVGNNSTGGAGGGAICNAGFYDGESSPQITNAVFIANHAMSEVTGGGGAILNYEVSTPTIVNAVFIGNNAGMGGAIYNKQSSPRITNATFTGNSADSNGGAIHNTGYSNLGNLGGSYPIITNSIFFGNTRGFFGPEIHENTGASTLRHNIIQGGCPSGSDCGDGSTIIDQAPQFVDDSAPAGADGRFGTAADGLRLREGSPALNAGDPSALDPDGDGTDELTVDITGADRVQDGTVDLGAYEGVGLAAPTVETVAPTAAHPGATLTIRGTDFMQIDGVTVGGVSASDVTAVSPERLDVVVPSGVGSGPIEVTNAIGTGSSSNDFRVPSPPYGSGRALALDGTDDYVSADAASDAMADADALTLEAWVYPDGGDRPAVFAFNGAGEDNKNILFYDSGRFQYYDPNISFQSSSGTFPEGQWHHVAIVIGADDSGALYVNGTEQATFTTSVRPVADGRFSIGQEWDNDTSSDFFDGRIDEVRLWTEARSRDEIRAAMHRTIESPASATSLAGNWRFDEDVSSTAYDLAGPGIGTVEGGPQRPSSGAPMGQSSTLVPKGTPANVGQSGLKIAATRTDTNTDSVLALYHYGTAGDDPVTGESFPDDISRRSSRVWGVENTGSVTADLTIHYEDLQTVALSNVRLLKRSGPTGAWQNVTTEWAWDEANQTFSKTGVSSFSEFAIGEAATPLPVELGGFEAEVFGEAVTLTWQTVSETGNAGFDIQRQVSSEEPFRRNGSTEGGSWQTVGSVRGAGTTDEPQSYRFTDEDLPYDADSLTYRLQQIDTDGSTSYSDPITVARSAIRELELLGTYPNPARSQATVRFAVPEAVGEHEVRLRLYDVMGRQVRTVQTTAEAGRHRMQLRVSDLASGVYFLRLAAGGEVQTRKLTVVR